jgi:hypothetical protein
LSDFLPKTALNAARQPWILGTRKAVLGLK